MPGCPTVVPAGVLVRLIWQFGSADYAVNVLGARNPASTVINQALANALGTAIKASFTSSGLAALMSTNVGLSRVGVRDINTASNAEFLSGATATLGTGTGDALPKQIAYCVTLRTAKAGPRFRGRQFIPGFVEANNDANGNPAAAVITAATAFVTAVQGNLSSNGLTLAVISRPVFDANCQVTRAGVATDVTSIVGRQTNWQTIRKRAIPGI